MSLIVEDGSVVTGAESYCTVAFATQYHSDRGHASWALLTNAVMEQCLRKATDYAIQVYRQRWKGYRKTATQALDWPRSFCWLEPFTHGAVGTYPYLVADTVVPTEIMNACASLALRAATGTLLADQTRRKSNVTVGPISTTYEAGSKLGVTYAEIDAMLRSYLDDNQIKLVRA